MDKHRDWRSGSSMDTGVKERETPPETLPFTEMRNVSVDYKSIERNKDTVDYRLLEENIRSNVVHGPLLHNKTQSPFSVRKHFAQGMCDTALMMANVSQLRAVIESGLGNRFFIPLLVMVLLSLLLQIIFSLVMIQKWRRERQADLNHEKNARKCSPQTSNSSPGSHVSFRSPGTQSCTCVSCTKVNQICLCLHCKYVERLDEWSVFLVFPIILLNIGIAGIGLPPPVLKNYTQSLNSTGLSL